MALLDDLTLGRYRPGNSWLHRYDPRLKLLFLPLCIVLIFSSVSFYQLMVPGVLIVLLIWMTQVEWRFWWRGVWVLRWLLLVSLLLHLLFSPGRTLFGTSWLSFDGLLRGLLIDAQVVLVVLCSSLLTLTTAPRQQAAAFACLISPLRRLRFPVEETAALLMMMFHFFPLLRAEAQATIQVLQRRDVSFLRGSLSARTELLRQLVPPLIFRLIDQADRLAIGLVTHDPSVEELVHLPAMPPLRIVQIVLSAMCCMFLVLVYWTVQ